MHNRRANIIALVAIIIAVVVVIILFCCSRNSVSNAKNCNPCDDPQPNCSTGGWSGSGGDCSSCDDDCDLPRRRRKKSSCGDWAWWVLAGLVLIAVLAMIFWLLWRWLKKPAGNKEIIVAAADVEPCDDVRRVEFDNVPAVSPVATTVITGVCDSGGDCEYEGAVTGPSIKPTAFTATTSGPIKRHTNPYSQLSAALKSGSTVRVTTL